MPVAYQGLGHDLDCVLQQACIMIDSMCAGCGKATSQDRVHAKGLHVPPLAHYFPVLRPSSTAGMAPISWSQVLRLPAPAYNLHRHAGDVPNEDQAFPDPAHGYKAAATIPSRESTMLPLYAGPG